METAFEIDAEYVDGQFRPLGEVKLPENARVKLTAYTSRANPTQEEIAEWLASTRAHREEMFAKNGYFTDSTALIAALRRGDPLE